MNNADIPAMPQNDGAIEQWNDPTDPAAGTYFATGLTKREHFAGLALQGFIASGYYKMNMAVGAAVRSVRAADELLAELNK
tara:strand:+ start:124 stop:366 length:243 start_codon:yes stop_codon:yes gene_type:complete